MIQKHKGASIRGMLFFIAVLINVIIIRAGFTVDAHYYYLLMVSLPAAIFVKGKLHLLSWAGSSVNDQPLRVCSQLLAL